MTHKPEIGTTLRLLISNLESSYRQFYVSQVVETPGGQLYLALYNEHVLHYDPAKTAWRGAASPMLTSWHFRPTAVTSGPEALAQLRQAVDTKSPFTLAILDGMMPEMDGFELAEHIKRDSALSQTAIIVLTSGDRPGDLQRAREIGVVRYLLKPIKREEFREAIVRNLPSPSA